MTQWKQPPIIKLYEALGAIGDGRVERSGNTAKVWSSSRGKSYDVRYDPEQRSITANDNGSYWQGYLGYPAIAFLLDAGVLKYDHKLADILADIAWKDINVKFKNDWAQTEQLVREMMVKHHPDINLEQFDQELSRIMVQLEQLGLSMLGPRQRPPAGY